MSYLILSCSVLSYAVSSRPVLLSYGTRPGLTAQAGGLRSGSPTRRREAWELQVIAAVREEISETTGVDSEQVEVTVSTTTDACDLFEVTVDADYTFNTIVAWGGVPISTPLSKRVVMRQLR